MQNLLWELYQSGKFADLTITCQGRTFQVHRNIVCVQCPFLNAAYERQVKGSANSTIDLPDEDPKSIALLLQFLYSGNYSDGEYFDGLPSVPAMMDAEEVQEEMLKKDPDTIMSLQFDEDEFTVGSEDSYITNTNPYEDPCRTEEPLEYDSDRCDEEPEEIETVSTVGMNAISLQTLVQLGRKEDCDISYDRDLCASVFTSLQMYRDAERYQIPSLRLLAQERFMRSVEAYWGSLDCLDETKKNLYGGTKPELPQRRTTLDGFVGIMNKLFIHTELNDPLRRFLCNVVGEGYSKREEIRQKIRPVVEKHPDFAIHMMDSMVYCYRKEEEEPSF